MFMIYSVLIGLVAGAAVGGRLSGLATLEFRWAPAIIAGLLIQVLLFRNPIAERIGDLRPAIYVGSTLLVLAAVARNAGIRGMPVVVVGAASNVVAILANGGFMPASQGALAALGKSAPVSTRTAPWSIARPVAADGHLRAADLGARCQHLQRRRRADRDRDRGHDRRGDAGRGGRPDRGRTRVNRDGRCARA